MLALISKLVPYGRLIRFGLIGAAILGIGGLIWWQRHHIAAQHATITGLKGDLVKVSAIAQENAQAAQEAQSAARRAQAALAAVSATQQTTQRRLGAQLATIHAAPQASADAPVPGLVWSTIQGLAK